MEVTDRGSQKKDSDEEEVTETLVVGMTESGVLRKRSIKRKVTKGEKSKLRGYGSSKTDYDAIITRIFQQKMVQESIDTLKERLKMVVLMRDDCMELVSQWDVVRNKQQRMRQAFDVELFAIALVIILIVAFWMLLRWSW